MHLTKTETAVLKLFTSRITEQFTIREIARRLGQNYSIVYSAAQKLCRNALLTKDKHKSLALNCKGNCQVLAHIEHLRAEEFLRKNRDIALFAEETAKTTDLGFYILLLFGSYAEGSQTQSSDIDILMVIENLHDAEKTEKHLRNISEKYGDFDCHVVSTESVKEMVGRKGKLNVVNESLNRHIIFFGAESYYRMIAEWL